MSNTPPGDGSLRFGVFILQYGGGVEGGHALYNHREFHPRRVPDDLLHGLHLHPGTVTIQNRPRSTTSSEKQRESEKDGGFLGLV